jgi:hypothetical protein
MQTYFCTHLVLFEDETINQRYGPDNIETNQSMINYTTRME